MKKTILALAVFAISATSFNAFAQTDGNKGQVECCVSENVCVNNRPSAKECRMQKMFDGITLTADQQANISKLNEKCYNECGKARKECRQACDGKQKKSKVSREERRAKMKTVRIDYLKGLKTILTPEQYTQFLENNFVDSFHGKMKGKGHHKCNKDCRNRQVNNAGKR
jgi:Spy/CpxP family protein refolding chaperone